MDNGSRFASLNSSSSSPLGDDEASPEIGLNIASLQNLVTLEYETAFS
jgi:hypothetical protein